VNSVPSSEPSLPSRPGMHWPSIAQFALSLTAAFISFTSAISLAGLGFVQLINPAGLPQQAVTLFIGAASGFLVGVLLLPSAWYALLRLIGKPSMSPAWVSRASNHPILLVLALILVLLALMAGNFISNNPRIAWLLPPLQLMAVGLPVFIFSTIGRWKLSAGSPQRSWGIFSLGLVLGPAVILVLEILAGIALFFLAILYISLQPDLQREMMLLVQRLNAARNSPDTILSILRPYLTQPLVLLTMFAFVSGIVPLIEEFLKPIGVWFVAGRRLSAAQGFAAGLLSGTGYALFENMAVSSIGNNWAITVIARMGTAVMHITTAGLMGWALITAINERRYLRLGVIYLLSVFIHGLWNSLALLSAVSDLSLAGTDSQARAINNPALISQWAAIGIGIMVVVVFLVLLRMNRVLRRAAKPEFL
jgi:hypothetical protein